MLELESGIGFQVVHINLQEKLNCFVWKKQIVNFGECVDSSSPVLGGMPGQQQVYFSCSGTSYVRKSKALS